MGEYPGAVAKIANDYLDRVKAQLRLMPDRDQEEFVKEIQSHIYEAFQQTPGEDEVERILAVLRKLGEPADVVADRLPHAMVRSGTKRNLPVYIVGGIFIALFGVPLGFGGVAVLAGLLCALLGLVVAYIALTGSVLLTGSIVLLMGFCRYLTPHLWDRLVEQGFIQIGRPVADFLANFSASEQGLILILFASVFLAAGFGLLWAGKYLIRGLRFLFSLVFDGMRTLAQNVRRRFRTERREVNPGVLHQPGPAR